jgi:CO dehydrogenase maturation factor
MTKIIAIAGKGGVGKSTFSSLLVKNIIENKDTVILAVDADSNSTLGQMLGVKVEQSIGDLREEFLKEKDSIPQGMSKHEYVQYELQLAMTEGDKFDLITMGRPEGPGCYCAINNILRTYMDALADKYQYIVIDNEAGMEHLSRRTTKAMDKFFIVTDFTPIGFETAERITSLAKEMEIEIKDVYLVINRIPQESIEHQRIKELKESGKYKEVYTIPNDDQLINHAFEGKPIIELPSSSPAVSKIAKISRETGIIS